jgi:hypothetical protein
MQRRSNDPIKTAGRKVRAGRRAGVGAVCTNCGQSDPQKLVARSKPKYCHECYELQHGRKPKQGHHMAGKANSSVTVGVSTNDHQGVLSDAQRDWPVNTLQNPDGSPLLSLAGMLRGTADFIGELIAKLLQQCAEFAEDLDTFLRQKHGEWWRGTPFDGWEPG